MQRLTLAQRHQLRTRAEIDAAKAPADDMAGATTYELQLVQLKQDQHRLKQMQSIKARNELKPQLLDKYDAYISGAIKGGKGSADEVLTTVMLWHFDTQNFEKGLEIATYALEHNMKMPDRFARTLPTLVAEEVANAALEANRANGEFKTEVIERAYELTAQKDMPDEVRAKLIFALAKNLQVTEKSDVATLKQAEELMQRAVALHDRVGAKKDIERIERWIKKHA